MFEIIHLSTIHYNSIESVSDLTFYEPTTRVTIRGQIKYEETKNLDPKKLYSISEISKILKLD